MLYRTLKPNVLTQEELQEIFDSIDFELAKKRNKEIIQKHGDDNFEKSLTKKR